MPIVKAIIENGVARPLEPLGGREGEIVDISLRANGQHGHIPDQRPLSDEEIDAAYVEFFRIIEECSFESGITDLAANHDHYVHGKPESP